MNPRKKLRALLAHSGYAIVPGAYDTLSASQRRVTAD
jgi:2-methylisocitrate lyase-like PEP mutase family enzyme